MMVLYMVSAIGISYSMHYCSGKFKEVCFTADTEKNCCGDSEKDGCCTDKVVSFKCKDSHTPAAYEEGTEVFYFVLPLVVRYGCPSYTGNLLVRGTTIVSGLPPPVHLSRPPVYLLNCVFRV